MTPRFPLAFAAFALLATSLIAEPENLGLLKSRVLTYLESAEFTADAGRVAADAIAHISERAANRAEGERLAIVLDIDETALSNLPHMRAMDFGYVPSLWDDWLDTAAGPAIAPVLEIYKAAREHDVAAIFITGRREKTRAATIRNLIKEGYAEIEVLLMKEDFSTEPTGDFKARERKRLTGEGWTIIASVGDQLSDLEGGCTERGFKIPNPAYFIK